MKKNSMNKNYIKYLSGIINEEQFYFEEEMPVDTKENFKKLLIYAKQLVAIYHLHEDEIKTIYRSPKGHQVMKDRIGTPDMEQIIKDLIVGIHYGISALDSKTDRTGHQFTPHGGWDLKGFFPNYIRTLSGLIEGKKNSLLYKTIEAAYEVAQKDPDQEKYAYENHVYDSIAHLNDGINKAEMATRAAR